MKFLNVKTLSFELKNNRVSTQKWLCDEMYETLDRQLHTTRPERLCVLQQEN